MGGKFSRAVTRPFKNYNVEDRAQRVLARSQEVVRPAPRYPSEVSRQKEPVQDQQQRLDRNVDLSAAAAAAAMPVASAKPVAAGGADLHAKHDDLNERLKGLYVQSVGSASSTAGGAPAASQRKLPEYRGKVSDTEHGYREPIAAPPRGRVTLKQALELISSHHANKKQFDAEAAAKQYNLEARQAQQLLRYFQSYNLAMPKKGSAEASSAASSAASSSLPQPRQLQSPSQPKQL